jgi:hypothetical protein
VAGAPGAPPAPASKASQLAAPLNCRIGAGIRASLRRDGSGDPAKHAPENELMDGAPEIPVREPDVSGRVKHGGLADASASIRLSVDLELQPQSPRNLHLRRQTKQPGGFEALDAPEIDRVADPEVLGITPPTPEPDTPAERVEHATHRPEPTGRIPSGPPPDTLNRLERGRDRGIDANRPPA